MDKNDAMTELFLEAADVHLAACNSQSKLVWGEGNLDSRLVIVGEAPGREEDRLGRPFVGAAGRLLDEEIVRAGMARDDAYITNVVKYRPVHEGSRANRTPSAREVAAWRRILMREIDIVAPAVVLCLGGVAASTVIHPDFAMRTERGKWFDGPSASRVIATYHPAYLRRKRATLEVFRKDLASVREMVKGDCCDS